MNFDEAAYISNAEKLALNIVYVLSNRSPPSWLKTLNILSLQLEQTQPRKQAHDTQSPTDWDEF